ncbi:hypothetical protein D3C78_1418840 [compost metagenome]
MGDAAGELADGFHFLRMTQCVFGPFALEHFALQALVEFGQGLGALVDPFLQGFIEVAQGLLGLSALGFVDHEDVETVDRAVGTEAWQVFHQRVTGATVAVR